MGVLEVDVDVESSQRFDGWTPDLVRAAPSPRLGRHFANDPSLRFTVLEAINVLISTKDNPNSQSPYLLTTH